jgi:tRNA G26 N,N-dimethylase Trm1
MMLLMCSKMSHIYACTGCDHLVMQRVGKLHPVYPTTKPAPAPYVSTRTTATGPTAPASSPSSSCDVVPVATPPSGDAAAAVAGAGAAASPAVASAVKPSGFKYSAGTGPAVPQNCPHCTRVYQLGGPVWSEPIHDTVFLDKMIQSLLSQSGDHTLTPAVASSSSSSAASSSGVASTSSSTSSATSASVPPSDAIGTAALPVLTPKHPLAATKRLLALLALAYQELPDVPLYYTLDSLSATLHTTAPKSNYVRSSLLAAGYRVSCSHANNNALKTDAPMEAIWDVYRAWIQLHPVKARSDTTPATMILAKPPVLLTQFHFTDAAVRVPHGKYHHLEKFLLNPEDNWGPKSRAHSTNKRKGPAPDISTVGAAGAAGAAAGDGASVSAPVSKRQANQNKYTDHSNSVSKTFPCRNYVPGQPNSCNFGRNCKYLHADTMDTGAASAVAVVATSDSATSAPPTL